MKNLFPNMGPLLLALALTAGIAHAQQPPLRLLQTIPLPNVHGRIDHFDIDLKGQRLFMSALGNNTVEVFDLKSNKVIHTISGLQEPQGVTYAPDSNRIFVANGGDGTCRVFDGTTYQLVKSTRLSSDADDTRYDAATKRVFVGYGDEGNAGLAVFDAASGDLVETIPLSAHPESFQLEAAGSRIFVNVPSAGNTIDVVDRKTRKSLATWKLDNAHDNFPMALDETNHRLFVVCRDPAEVLVLDTESGKIVARIPCVSHADDAWYDGANQRIYVSGGGGFLTVIRQDSADRYHKVADMKTLPGARTSFLAPEQKRLYLGVWGRGSQPEELRVYEVAP